MRGNRIIQGLLSPSRRGQHAWISWSSIGLIVALALIAVVFTAAESSYNVYLLDSFLLTAMGAIALNTLMGTAGQVSVNTAGFLAIGAFGTVWLQRDGIGFPLNIIVVALFSAAVGIVVALPAVRLQGLALGLATIAAFYVIYFVVDTYQTDTPGAGAGGFSLPSVFNGNLTEVGRQWTWTLLGLVAVLVLITDRMVRGKFGRALRVIRDHEVIAPALGIPVIRYKLTAFAWSSFVLAASGGLSAYLINSVNVETFTLVLSIQYIAMILVGGRDSIVGAVIGAAIFSWLPFGVNDLSASWFGQEQASLNGAQFAQIAFGAIVLIFILASPDGLVGLFSTSVARLRLSRQRRSFPGGDAAPTEAVATMKQDSRS